MLKFTRQTSMEKISLFPNKSKNKTSKSLMMTIRSCLMMTTRSCLMMNTRKRINLMRQRTRVTRQRGTREHKRQGL